VDMQKLDGTYCFPACRAENVRGDLVVLFIDDHHLIVQMTESLDISHLPVLGSPPFSGSIHAIFNDGRILALMNDDKTVRAECHRFVS